MASRLTMAAGSAVLLLIAPAAQAEGDEVAPAPRAAPAPYVGEPLPKPAPVGRRGFQMTIRTGLAIPLGLAKRSAGGDVTAPGARSQLDEIVGWQIPVTLEIGGKPDPHIFIGGYTGIALGEPAGALGQICTDTASCLATNIQLGAEILYSFMPDGWVNPWLGYGFGFSWLTAGDKTNEVNLHGLELAHVLGGVDFRLTRTLGIAPYLDYSVGVYSHRFVTALGSTLVDGDIHGRAVHQWLVIGPRFVFFP
jgi:hypothetical protein